MPLLKLIVLYCDDLLASTAFYRTFLGKAPEEQSPDFAMFVLPSGLGIGLWARDKVAPSATAASGGVERGFVAEDVDAAHRDWIRRGATIAQEPTDMDFGRTFTALDPDGHRLRAFTPAA